MSNHDEVYFNLIRDVVNNGVVTNNRTDTETMSLFGYQSRYDGISDHFPLLTSKKMNWKSIVSELFWFLEGGTDERRLAELNYGKDRSELRGKRTIWTDNALHQGKELYGHLNHEDFQYLGPVYGKQWRTWDHQSPIDQIKDVINEIKTNPNSRRLMVSAWNAPKISMMALPPCPVMFQFRVVDEIIHMQMYQRSADIGLGVPYDIASYSVLLYMVAHECGLTAGNFIHTMGDAHIYKNHTECLIEQVERTPFESPYVRINSQFDLMDRLDNGFSHDDIALIELHDYKHHSAIKMDMVV